MMHADETPIPPRNLPDVCVRCATCMAVCPVSRVTPRFPGPKQAGPGAQRFRSATEVSVDDWIELCTACRLCEKGCPTQAITGAKDVVHVIDQSKCIKCGVCFEVCKFDAVRLSSGSYARTCGGKKGKTVLEKKAAKKAKGN